MLEFIHPVFAALIGVAVSAFGLLHSARLFPSASVWRQVGMAVPELTLIAVFLACVALAVAGIAMVVTGIRATRQRLEQIRRVRWQTEPRSGGRHGDEDEEPWN